MAYNNRPEVLLGVLWSGAALAIVFTAARLFTRLHLEPKLFGWDDGTMVLALILHLVGISLLSASVQAGLGQHEDTLQPAQATQAMLLQWLFQPPDVLSNTVARISISIFLIRVFPRKFAMKVGLIIMATLNTLAAIAGLSLIFTQCKPAAVLWDASIQGARCLPSSIQVGLATTKAALGAFSDVVTAGWPIAIIWKLQMQLRRKLLLALLFALSLLATLTCIMEARFLFANGTRHDETYIIAELNSWTASSAAVLIIIGNLPALVPLYFRYVRPDQSRDHNWPGKSYPVSDRTSRMTGKTTTRSTGTGFDDRNPKDSQDPIFDESYNYCADGQSIQMTTQVQVNYEQDTRGWEGIIKSREGA